LRHDVDLKETTTIPASTANIYGFRLGGAIKKDKETAKIVKAATSSFTDEAQDFRYGPPALQMLIQFVNKFPESDRYKRLDTRVFTMLAVDKERAMDEAKSSKPEFKEYLEKKAKVARTDDEFLEIMKSLFSVFDLEGSNFVVNQERFDKSLAKKEIKKIIDYIVDDIESYAAELEEWERQQKEREEELKYQQELPKEEEEESEVDAIVRKALYGSDEESEEEVDFSK
jgi:hypothetical protein